MIFSNFFIAPSKSPKNVSIITDLKFFGKCFKQLLKILASILDLLRHIFSICRCDSINYISYKSA